MVSYEVCQLVKNLVEDHNAGRERKAATATLFFAQFFDYADPASTPPGFGEEWEILLDWFQAHAHTRQAPFHDKELSDAEQHFLTLDKWLYVTASNEYARLKEINEILEDTNG